MEKIQDIAVFVIQKVFDDQQPYYEGAILSHLWAKDKFQHNEYRYSLQQWFYLKSGKPLKKTKKLIIHFSFKKVLLIFSISDTMLSMEG